MSRCILVIFFWFIIKSEVIAQNVDKECTIKQIAFVKRIEEQVKLIKELSDSYWVYGINPEWGGKFEVRVIDLGKKIEYYKGNDSSFSSRNLSKNKFTRICKIMNPLEKCILQFVEDGSEAILLGRLNGKTIFSYYCFGVSPSEFGKIIKALFK